MMKDEPEKIQKQRGSICGSRDRERERNKKKNKGLIWVLNWKNSKKGERVDLFWLEELGTVKLETKWIFFFERYNSMPSDQVETRDQLERLAKKTSMRESSFFAKKEREFRSVQNFREVTII